MTKRGRWKKGESGNPAGRKPGTGETAKIREAIAVHVPEIIETLTTLAKGGDVSAARVLLDRVVPGVKATEAAAPLDLPTDDGLANQGRAVMQAMADGELAPSQGAALLGALGSLAKLVETDELAARVAALEAKHGNES